MQEIVIGVQTCTLFRGPHKYRKHKELRSAVQTKPTFQNLSTMAQSQGFKAEADNLTSYFISGPECDSDK